MRVFCVGATPGNYEEKLELVEGLAGVGFGDQ